MLAVGQQCSTEITVTTPLTLTGNHTVPLNFLASRCLLLYSICMTQNKHTFQMLV